MLHLLVITKMINKNRKDKGKNIEITNNKKIKFIKVKTQLKVALIFLLKI